MLSVPKHSNWRDVTRRYVWFTCDNITIRNEIKVRHAISLSPLHTRAVSRFWSPAEIYEALCSRIGNKATGAVIFVSEIAGYVRALFFFFSRLRDRSGRKKTKRKNGGRGGRERKRNKITGVIFPRCVCGAMFPFSVAAAGSKCPGGDTASHGYPGAHGRPPPPRVHRRTSVINNYEARRMSGGRASRPFSFLSVASLLFARIMLDVYHKMEFEITWAKRAAWG